MKKKIIILSILAIFMIITISLATAVNTKQVTKQKESPIYKNKINKALGKNINKIKENFLKNRIFLRFKMFDLNSCQEEQTIPTLVCTYEKDCPITLYIPLTFCECHFK